MKVRARNALEYYAQQWTGSNLSTVQSFLTSHGFVMESGGLTTRGNVLYFKYWKINGKTVTMNVGEWVLCPVVASKEYLSKITDTQFRKDHHVTG